jgi:nitroreductase
MEIDVCPMEGFDPQAYNRLLGLDDIGFHATLVMPIGYRLDSDKYAQLPKVRYSLEEVMIEC